MTKEKEFLKKELDFLELYVWHKSRKFKEWIDEQFRTLGSETNRPSLSGLLEKYDYLDDDEINDIEKIVEYGSMDGLLPHYYDVFMYLSDFIEKRRAAKYPIESMEYSFRCMRERHKMAKRIKTIKEELCGGSEALSVDKIRSAFESLRQEISEIGSGIDKAEEELKFFEESNGQNVFVASIRQMKIMSMLRNDPRITIEMLARGIKCSSRTISRDLKALEDAGRIKNIGGRNGNGSREVVVPKH